MSSAKITIPDMREDVCTRCGGTAHVLPVTVERRLNGVMCADGEFEVTGWRRAPGWGEVDGNVLCSGCFVVASLALSAALKMPDEVAAA